MFLLFLHCGPAAKWKSVQNRLTEMVKDGVIDVVGKRDQASVYGVAQAELVESR